MEIKQVCRDHGRPGCLEVPDERYTMRFDDIGEEPIYWCTHCGPEAHALNDIIVAAFKANPAFYERAKELIEKAEAENEGSRN